MLLLKKNIEKNIQLNMSHSPKRPLILTLQTYVHMNLSMSCSKSEYE